jgi:outer membrane protein assembly factor BamB
MKFSISFLILSTFLYVGTLCAEDVLRFRGHNSQGKYNEPGLLKKWPENGLTPKWINSDLGSGWSSVIKVKDRLYLNCIDPSERKQESVVCLDLNGKKIWQTRTGQTWTKSYAASRSTPTYISDETGDKLVVLTGSGEVCCLDSKSGKLLWKKDVADTYNGKPGRWGYAESLVVKNGKVFATPCGDKVSVVALNLKDGSTAWEAPSNGDKCAYVTPVIYKDQLIQFTSTYVFAVDIEKGKIVWKTDYSKVSDGRWKGINCNTPLLKDNQLFVTAGYNQGGVMYEILPGNKGVKLLWKTADLDPHHDGVVELDGKIYGSNWLNNRAGNWVCIDWKTGKTIYNEAWEKLGKGIIITADGMLYIYEEKRGTLGLVKPGNKFDVVSKFPVKFGSKEHWSHPIISDGVFYVRHGNGLAAFDIRQK